MRKKKHGAQRIEACSEFLLKTREDVETLTASKGGFPVYLEIGCGKGDFAVTASERFSDHPFIAMEKFSDVALLAMEKAKAKGCENLHFFIADARTLEELFSPGQIQILFLNFSDPWPKKGYAKRRLTHRNFLETYKKLLAPGGEIRFKTDNRPLFDFSLEEFEAAGFTLRNVTCDLHQSPLNEGNIVTEYERNFSAKGFSINYLEAYIAEAASE